MIKIFNSVIHPQRFPDGTLNLNINPDVYHLRALYMEITWLYENDGEMFTLMCILDVLKRNGWNPEMCVLKMPYCPHARMDRIKHGEENFSLKVFSKWLNTLGIGKIITENIHSNVSEALIDKLVNKNPTDDILEVDGKYQPDMIFFPDEGACKRYSDLKVIKELNLPIAFGIKKRDWKTGEILGLDVIGEDFVGKKVIIIDDICSKGNTFKFSAMKLKELGVKDVALYVTHCEDTVLDGELLNTDWISQIYTTNSICHVSHPKIKIIRKF